MKTNPNKRRNKRRTQYQAFVLASITALVLPCAANAQAASPQAPAEGAAPESTTRPLSFEPSVGAELIVSDNGNFGILPEKKSEVTAVVTPALAFRRDSPNLRLNGSIGLSAYTYANNTQEDTVLPRLDVAAFGTIVRDLLTVDASVRTRDFLLTPLSAENAGGIAPSRYNAIQSRVAPMLIREFGPNIRFEAASDNAWTTYAGESAGRLADAYTGAHQVSLRQRAQPFGWSIEATRSEAKYDSINFENFTTDKARAGIEYLFSNEFSVGLGGGHERNRFPEFSVDGSTSYVNLRWRPVPATSLFAEVQKRFFGNEWTLEAQYRTPIFALNARAWRDLETFQQQLLSLPRAGNVASLIDEILVGRITDPVQRAQTIQDLINRRALPSQVDQATAVYTERIELTQGIRISAALLGARNSLVLAVVRDRREDVPGFDDVLTSRSIDLVSGKRVGVTLAWNHRLSTISAIDSEIATTNSTSGTQFVRKAKQTRAQVIYSLTFSPRSVGSLGYRFQRYDINDSEPDRENAIFATLVMRF
ncbi:MAG: TIGR03016 family PEP-CTERM system-associated outer membrane protein [Burkholderiaceae bacterium]